MKNNFRYTEDFVVVSRFVKSRFHCTFIVCRILAVRNMKRVRKKLVKKKTERKKEENKLTRPGIIQSSNELSELNQGPSDLQPDALPTELSRQLSRQSHKNKENNSESKKKQLLSLTVSEPRLWKERAATSQSKSNNKAKKKNCF